jgi:hypothetical protein
VCFHGQCLTLWHCCFLVASMADFLVVSRTFLLFAATFACIQWICGEIWVIIGSFVAFLQLCGVFRRSLVVYGELWCFSVLSSRLWGVSGSCVRFYRPWCFAVRSDLLLVVCYRDPTGLGVLWWDFDQPRCFAVVSNRLLVFWWDSTDLGVLRWEPTDLGVLRSDPIYSWCFAARSDCPLQFSGEFLTCVEAFSKLTCYFFFKSVFVWFALSCSSLRGSVRVRFSRCFSFACFLQAELIWYICSSLRGSVRRVIRVCESLRFGGILVIVMFP